VRLQERGPLLALLREFHADAIGGAGCIVFVSGEAGAGKSALVRRFCDDLPADSALHYGFCDAFHTPRALGPLHDIARSGLDGLSNLLAAAQDRHIVFSEFLDLLAARPSVTVIEDIHWADEATLDLLVFLGRRVADLPCMVVVTLRGDEVGGDHPIRRVLGDLATARSVRRLTVPPLSQAAVAQLAEPAGRDAAWLYAVTGGNPFFVTEALAAPGQSVPATVRDAVAVRAARLSRGARAVLDLVSAVPDRAEVAMIAPVITAGIDTPASVALDEAVESGMLVRDGETVRIRHELARRAIEADMSVARAAEQHRGILAFLAASPDADPARLSYHADAAADSDAVLRYAPLAGKLAAGVGAHREAAEQYDRALRHAAGVPAAQLAELWEGRADACERSQWMTARTRGADQLSGALEASARAVELWRAVGDGEREVVVVARRSHILWNAGRREEAQDTARAAVALLETLPPGPGPARAYAALARLFMLAHDDAAAVSLGTTAVSYAQRFEQGGALVEALGVIGNAQWTTDPDRAAELLTAALNAARGAGDDLGVAAILCNLGSGAAEIRRYPQAHYRLGEAVAWCAERHLDSLRDLGLSWLARCHLERGRWDEASAAAAAVIGSHPQPVLAEVLALTVVGRLRSRRGDPDAQPPLDEAWSLVESSDDLRRLWPVAAARAENAWLAGATREIAPLVTETYHLAVRADHPWAAGELGHWMRIAGAATDPAARVAAPYALQANGDWAGAAQLWRELGCPYEMALAMACDDDLDRQLAALQELHCLGAWSATELVARRLRRHGLRNLPRRPRRTTRNNPAQLTERQLDVLALLAEGLRNADISAALHISPKTVDHHVSAILAKLGVDSRRQAASWARAAPTEHGTIPDQI
jgi:DNA-binding CsgD family transcriptional regulator/tetratricopeptide (TPR) repeat protein